MSMDWCLGIRQACTYWQNAPMLQQTFQALEQTLAEDNDACIDGAKCVVEVVCRLIVESFHSSKSPIRPDSESPTLSEWLAASVKALKLGDIRDDRFRKVVSSHNRLADALNDLRNKAGPVSHGKDAYLRRLAIHHRRTAVLAADTIVAFLHNAYLETQLDPINSKEPYERFEASNLIIDANVEYGSETDNNGDQCLTFSLPTGDVLRLKIEPSRLLYLIDREAYVEALNAAQYLPDVDLEEEDEGNRDGLSF